MLKRIFFICIVGLFLNQQLIYADEASADILEETEVFLENDVPSSNNRLEHFNALGLLCEDDICDCFELYGMHLELDFIPLDENVPMGELEIGVNVNINTPQSFINQDILVLVYCPDYDPYNDSYDDAPAIVQGLYSIQLSMVDYYRGEINLPVGTYTFVGGEVLGVPDPYACKLYLPSEPFVISENEQYSTTLNFFDNNVNPLISAGIPAEGRVVFRHSQETSFDEIYITFSSEEDEKYEAKLSLDNFWKDELYIPIGNYVIDSALTVDGLNVELELTEFSVGLGDFISIATLSTGIDSNQSDEELEIDQDNNFYLILAVVILAIIFLSLCNYAYLITKEDFSTNNDDT